MPRVNRLQLQTCDLSVQQEGYMTASQASDLRDRELELLSAVRPNAVAYVDAFDFSDWVLGSVLGRFDGQVYDNLYRWAQKSTLNKSQVMFISV